MLQRKLRNAGLAGGSSFADLVTANERHRAPQEHKTVKETARSVVRMITQQGGYSGDCRRVPVSLPRVTFIDGAFA